MRDIIKLIHGFSDGHFLLTLMLLISGVVLASEKNNFDTVPRPEHPKPQFYREQWLNLNGEWNFEFDFNLSGIEKDWHSDPSGFNKKILVPFCPESKLSRIEYTDFIPAVWYHRSFEIPEAWNGSRIFLHFGAVDYDCRVWVNGTLVGRHYGGSASFCFEISRTLNRGQNDVVVYAMDDIRSGIQPAGKQSDKSASYTIMYTRTTGIWQTVWLEARSQGFLESVQVTPDLDNSRFVLTPHIQGHKKGWIFKATLLSEDEKELCTFESAACNGIPVFIDIQDPRVWSPDDPYLYSLRYELIFENQIIDQVYSYAGLRKFHIEGNGFFLNNEPVFLRFVLDQGFYPNGIWTAPSEEDMIADIERSLAVGFNGARLHQKVFEERFHYWADKLGYLTWSEFNDWGLKIDSPRAMLNLQREWCEVVARDVNHPSIIAWVPTNERSAPDMEVYRQNLQETVNLTRAIDPCRPVNDASGFVHVDTDIFSVHDYDQNPHTFRERYDSLSLEKSRAFICYPEKSVPYNNQPYVVDEYGGTTWNDFYASSKPMDSFLAWEWAYGKTSEMVEDHIEGLTSILLNNAHIAGFCYTQLYDIEYERNGIYTYNRTIKFNQKRLKEIFGAPAAIEKKIKNLPDE
ncbi:MAG: beta-glucuronidase [Bacteroidales bacterium]|nr:beta-glucuronidase [Bacteroidales bacterium]